MENNESEANPLDLKALQVTLSALICVLHEQGVTPVQALADYLDRIALLPEREGSDPMRRQAAQSAARAFQALADTVQRKTPFQQR